MIGFHFDSPDFRHIVLLLKPAVSPPLTSYHAAAYIFRSLIPLVEETPWIYLNIPLNVYIYLEPFYGLICIGIFQTGYCTYQNNYTMMIL